MRVEIHPFSEERAGLEGELRAWASSLDAGSPLSSVDGDALVEELLPFGVEHVVLEIRREGSTWFWRDSTVWSDDSVGTMESSSEVLPTRYQRFVTAILEGAQDDPQ